VKEKTGEEMSQEAIDEGVARELESGTFEAVDPETGTFARVDTDEDPAEDRED